MLALFSLVVLALQLGAASAQAGIVDLPITAHRPRHFGGHDGAEKLDRRRLDDIASSRLEARCESKVKTVTFPAVNVLNSYVAKLGVGTPPTYFDVNIDTGSSTTFVGCGRTTWKRTRSTVDTGYDVRVGYGLGGWNGTEYNDTVTLAKGLVIKQQGIGVARKETCHSFSHDGLLGVGPTGASRNLVGTNATVPTVIDNAYGQKLVSARQLGMYYEPSRSLMDAPVGTLTFGGANPKYYTGKLRWHPLTKVQPAANFWGLDAERVLLGKRQLNNASLPGIHDSGTTLILLGPDLFKAWLDSIPGATTDPKPSTNIDTTLVRIPVRSVKYMKSLTFVFNRTPYTLQPSQLLAPQHLVKGADPRYRYSYVADLGSATNPGLQWMLGLTWLERFYSVIDSDNNRIGFASTKWTDRA